MHGVIARLAVQNEIRWGSTLAIRTSVSKWCAIGVLHPTACRTPLERTESDSARHILISISTASIEKHRGRTSVQGSSKLQRSKYKRRNANQGSEEIDGGGDLQLRVTAQDGSYYSHFDSSKLLRRATHNQNTHGELRIKGRRTQR